MKKILLTFILCASSFNIARAYTFGPIEGGNCSISDACDIWIDQISSKGGQVNLKWDTNRWGLAEGEIINFVRRHCEIRGYLRYPDIGPKTELGGINHQAAIFTCFGSQKTELVVGNGGYDPKASSLIKDSNNQTQSNLNVKEVKAKCFDLGFKPKTEKFADCVLELTK